MLNNTAYYIAYVGQDDRFDRYFPVVKQMINSFKLLLPSSTNLTNSTFGLEDSITGTNETTSTSPRSNLTTSNQTTPTNLTFMEGNQSLPLLELENKLLEKDKVVDIQIRTTEKNGSSETVNFVPNEIVVDSGTVVTWTNNHSSVHTVTSVNNNTFGNNNIATGKVEVPLFDSDYLNTGEKISYNFGQPGRFDYFDKNNDNLKGAVFVKQTPSQINNISSQVDNEKTGPEGINLIPNDDFESSNINNSGILDNFTDINGSSVVK